MVDTQDSNAARFVVNLVDNSIGTSLRRPQPVKVVTQPVTHPPWVLHQGSEHEFYDSDGSLLRETCKRSLGRRSDYGLPLDVGHSPR